MQDFVFCFGYHGPDGLRAVSEDASFDFESTGALVIAASSESSAFEWGVEVAQWYAAQIHADSLVYSWSQDDYAVWVEPAGESDEDVEHLPRTKAGEFPDLSEMRSFLNDQPLDAPTPRPVDP